MDWFRFENKSESILKECPVDEQEVTWQMDDPQTDLIAVSSLTLEQAGKLADEAAADALFADFQRRLAEETRRRHRADLALFTRYLTEAGIQVGNLLADPAAWRGMTWGLVQGFAIWQLREGYAVSSVNVRLSTINAYARVAAQVGGLSMEAYGYIQLMKGYRKAEARHLDKDHTVTRRGTKKAKPRFLSLEEVARLKSQPNTPQGRRDAVLMCLFLDHGLRCGDWLRCGRSRSIWMRVPSALIGLRWRRTTRLICSRRIPCARSHAISKRIGQRGCCSGGAAKAARSPGA